MDLSLIPAEDRESARDIIARCMVDRIFFVEAVLGVRPNPAIDDPGVEDWQREVLRDLDSGETKVSIKSAIGVGKTCLVAWLGLHFVLFRDDVKVVVTSPSFSQLQDGLIPEVRKWRRRLPQWLRDQLDISADRISRKPDPANNFISFRTARKEQPEALQGIHATHVLLLVDEASGVDEAVFEAGQGTMSTTGSIAVLISNPTRVTGLFYRTHRKLRDLWKTYSITSFRSSRVDPSFPELMARTYGIDSQQYKVRVLAEFPEGNADSVIPRAWVEQSIGRDIVPTGGEVRVWGLDPGRGGDPTGFCERCGGGGITALHELYNDNLMTVVGWVKRRWDRTASWQRPKMIYVDVIGIGAGVSDRLEELGLPVTAINVAEVAAMEDRFPRLRAELWHEARLFFERKDCYIATDIEPRLVDKFVEELAEPQFKDHSSGKLDVESKKDLRARGIASPNLADAFCLTLAQEGAVMNGLTDDVFWGKPLNYSYKGVV